MRRKLLALAVVLGLAALLPGDDPANPERANSDPDKKNQDVPDTLSSASQAEPSPSINKHSCHCRPDETPWWKKVVEVSALFVGIYAALTYKGQLDQMIKGTKAAKGAACAAVKSADLTRLQIRPWVTLGSACITTDDEFFKVMHPATNTTIPACGNESAFQNFALQYGTSRNLRWWAIPAQAGQTPALHTKLTAAWCVSAHRPCLPECMRHALHSEDAPIAPGDKFGHGVYGEISPDDLKALSEEQFRALNPELKNGRNRLYVVGTIGYTQPPAIHHWTEFCLFYSPHEVWPLIFCEGGNRTDDDQAAQKSNSATNLPHLGEDDYCQAEPDSSSGSQNPN